MKKYTHLSQDERVLIAHYHDNGLSLTRISSFLKRSKSTLSRELKRNSNKTSYTPETATHRYLARRTRLCALDRDLELQSYVRDRLYEGFSPEIIALRLKTASIIENLPYISYESIYKWLYKTPQKHEKLYKLLTQAHFRRARRKRIHRGRIANRVPIVDRPSEVESRHEIGHWEADLMSFMGNRQHMLVIHERKTRYTAAIKLQTKSAEETLEALIKFMKSVPKNLRKTITFDNGMEFSKHYKLTERLGMATYFCDVYASWQKGGIENMNGRLRRDLPRKTDLLRMRDEDLQQILISHNLLPRKVLNGKSPIEVLADHMGQCIFFSFKRGVALRP